MIWLDLGVASLLLWGAVSGYQMGLRRALLRLAALLCALWAALLGRAELKYFGAQHSILGKVMEAVVDHRLALPVSGPPSAQAPVYTGDLPAVLWEALQGGPALPVGGGDSVAASLVQLLGWTAAFWAGLALWWAFFHLCGSALGGREPIPPGRVSRWGGAVLGMIRQGCCAALTVGAAVILGWLCRIPPGLLQLERTDLAGRAWSFFVALRIWQ